LAETDWIIGIAFSFGLALVFTSITEKSLANFFVFLTIFSSFMVWNGFLPLWLIILELITLTIITYLKLNVNRI